MRHTIIGNRLLSMVRGGILRISRLYGYRRGLIVEQKLKRRVKVKWEYKTLVIPFSEVGREPNDLTAEYLMPLGEEGWELISCFRQMGGVGWVYTFKREKGCHN